MSHLPEPPSFEVAIVGSRPLERRPIRRALNLGALTKLAVRGTGVMAVAFGLAVGPFNSDALGWLQSHYTQGASSEPVSSTAEAVSRVALPTSPFIEAARQKDGEVSLYRMLELWHAAGVPVDEMLRVAKLHDPLGPTWMGTHDPQTQARFEIQARAAVNNLKVEYSHAWEKLSDPRWLEQQDIKPTQKKIRDIAKILAMEIDFPQATKDRPLNPEIMDDMAQSDRAIERAMRVSGVRSLQLSFLGAQQSSARMNVAHFLESGNQSLVQRTGWEGGVLGLGGRIDVVIDRGRPGDYHAFASSALKVNNHVVQRPQVIIQGQPSSYYHEWAHALDYTLARQAFLFNTSVKTLSETRQDLKNDTWPDLKIRRSGWVEALWGNTLDGLGAAAPQWRVAREERHAQSGNEYWTRIEEDLAFSFAGQMGVKDQSEPWRTPSSKEVATQKRLFDTLFAGLRDLELGKRDGHLPSIVTGEGTTTPGKRIKVDTSSWEHTQDRKGSARSLP